MTHTVADYDAWRADFDEGAAQRDAHVLINVAAPRDTSDENRIWLVADGDPDKPNEIAQDPEMECAAVTGPPEILIAG